MSIVDLIGKLSPDIQKRGRQFERICKWLLENDPEYKIEVKNVWLWDDWPGRWGRDKGIDLVAETFDRKFWAIQSKAYARNYSVTKQDFDKFLSESSRKIISYRLMISTAAEFGHNAKEVIVGQEKPVGTLFFSDLKNRKLNWPASPDDLIAKQAPPNKPRPDQRRAIADVVRGFKSKPRGQLIRACGTGKTLIGLRVAEAMKSQRTLVLVPSISLVSQILSDWAKDGLQPFRFLPVCSDETIGSEDELDVELGVPSSTDPTEIAKFMRGLGRRVVFSTYKSSPKIAQAYKRYKLKPFDLVIADEAHRCAGVNSGDAATILDPQTIRARKRLFMTATPCFASEATKSRADSMGLELVSMDDRKVFGPVFHELKFSEAIRRKLLTDYRVEIIGVDDPTYRQYAEEGKFVTLDGKTITDARTLASHIAVAKAVKKYDLRRIITFHGRVTRAREFAEQFPQFIKWMPNKDIPSGQIWAELIHGEMASNKRDAILDRLREVQPPARGIVTNARCLSEGIDVRALDGVAFIDPKESQVDIIQAVGRAIRKAERKRQGVIILPVYISSDEDEEKTLEDSSFKQVWRVLRALRSHDDQLASELDNLRTNLGKRGKVRASLSPKININLPTRLSVKFADAFYLRTVKAITPLPPLTIEQILRWADGHHRKTGQWPNIDSGDVPDAPGEKWANIQQALSKGLRSLASGSSLAQLLSEERGVRNHMALPKLSTQKILEWADAHYRKTGRWPKKMSGNVLGATDEKWSSMDAALTNGVRGLPAGSSLAKLLADKRGVRNIRELPKLTNRQILKWADVHHQKTGEWPTLRAGKVLDAPIEKWQNIDAALKQGLRGLKGKTSLTKLIAKWRGVRNSKNLPDFTVSQILRLAELHHQNTGEWPTQKSGAVRGAPGETWAIIHGSLSKGRRGLPGGSSLPLLLGEKRGVRNKNSPPNLNVKQILGWVDVHRRKTGQWPKVKSDNVLGAPDEKWANIDAALTKGVRGLRGGASLAKLLAEERGVRNRQGLTKLTLKQILKWADVHHQKTGEWPKTNSGDVMGAPGEKWANINAALDNGVRGLRGGSSLAQLLAVRRGVRNQNFPPRLSLKQILGWVDVHHRKTGQWPTSTSGEVFGAPEENWAKIHQALYSGLRGLTGGSSLANLLAEKRPTK